MQSAKNKTTQTANAKQKNAGPTKKIKLTLSLIGFTLTVFTLFFLAIALLANCFLAVGKCNQWFFAIALIPVVMLFAIGALHLFVWK